MHPPCYGGKRTNDRRYPGVTGRPEIPVFHDAIPKQEIFAEAIATFYPAGKDPATIEILRTLKD
jgi:hypothetical protein